MSPKLIEWIPLYWANRKPGRGRANGFIKRAEAVALVDQGMATFSTKGQRSLILKWKEWEIPKADLSSLMGAVVTERAAEGHKRFRRIAEAWHGVCTEPPLRLRPAQPRAKEFRTKARKQQQFQAAA